MADEAVDASEMLRPPKYVGNYMLETGWTFTEGQKQGEGSFHLPKLAVSLCFYSASV